MSALFSLAGKTAVITGSSRGIGRAIAEAYAAHGANVVISSRKQDACDTVAAAINAQNGGRAIAVAASIASKDDLRWLVDEARAAESRDGVGAVSGPGAGFRAFGRLGVRAFGRSGVLAFLPALLCLSYFLLFPSRESCKATLKNLNNIYCCVELCVVFVPQYRRH